ncbi:MAG: DNA gyrase inhibitor YacG [Gammaproteobacteria bacterium]|nr:DNA gyrase inhibitor YacG [Gammaproteobacteria bacterium]
MTTPVAPCPRCGRDASLVLDNPWRPFCSRRCKLIDLGDWLAERYSVPLEGDSDSGELPPADQ